MFAALLFLRRRHHFVFWQKWYHVKVRMVDINRGDQRRQQVGLIDNIKIYLPRRGNPLLFVCFDVALFFCCVFFARTILFVFGHEMHFEQENEVKMKQEISFLSLQ